MEDVGAAQLVVEQGELEEVEIDKEMEEEDEDEDGCTLLSWMTSVNCASVYRLFLLQEAFIRLY